MTSLRQEITCARATYAIRPLDIDEIICNSQKHGLEQYLVRWRTGKPEIAVYSWHSVTELRKSLHHVQRYLDRRRSLITNGNPAVEDLRVQSDSRKRKSPESDITSRDLLSTGLLTPVGLSRSSSIAKSVTANDSRLFDVEEPAIYNGYIEKKEGRLIAKASHNKGVAITDGRKLPTSAMVEASNVALTTNAEREIRKAFVLKLDPVKGVFLKNDIDSTTPSLDFEFIASYKFQAGTGPAELDTVVGCESCRPNMGQNIGCEYPQKCECLEYAAVDEQKLKAKDPARYEQYKQDHDPSGLPKRFPYTKNSLENRPLPSTLIAYYRDERHPIYECNARCRCGPRCKSRLVQKGRQVPLTIFKTAERGWGVCCNEDLIQGEFVDTYLGEVITNKEAERREEKAGKDKNSYLYSLDKFVGEMDVTEEDCFVVDGQHMGGPTRFINHSCEPNCRQYTVSYNKNDLRVYDIAFFAYENIPAGTELTFDYMDKDEEEEEDAIRARNAAINDPENVDKVMCNCGSTKCRGFLWV